MILLSALMRRYSILILFFFVFVDQRRIGPKESSTLDVSTPEQAYADSLLRIINESISLIEPVLYITFNPTRSSFTKTDSIYLHTRDALIRRRCGVLARVH
ncbi:hypothetical protein FRB91_009989 [Serendipita sp. 411]|nr:hypothetical protein FRB91_009989 [Serendipita sp. 411]